MNGIFGMKYRLLVLAFAVSLTAFSVHAQNISGVINTYAHVVDIDTCLNTATVPTTAGFNIGDRVLIIQMKGAQIDQSNTGTYGTITSMNGAGLFEIGTILSLPNLTTVRFSDKLLNVYDTKDGYVQLVRIPQYTDVTVSDTLRPQAWNPGSGVGGVLILEASGTLTLNAPIDASGMGFSGGSASSNGGAGSVSGFAFDGYTGALAGDGGYKGEGIASNIGIYVSIDIAGRGSAANGGGGGDAHNSGGGGGGNAKSGGQGGDQTDATGFGKFANGGEPGNAVAAGPLPTIFMGGGGGGGEQNDNFGTNGANGGGIIIIRAPKIISDFDTIKANGASQSSIAKSDGAGGGGAGGTIIVDADSIFLPDHTEGAISLQIKGGDGGSIDAQKGPFAFGPGGGGAGGVYSRIGNGWGLWFVNQNGGKAGIVTNCTNPATNDSAYGATDGAYGSSLDFPIPESSSPYNYPAGANIHLFSICAGDSIAISASGADSYLWTPSAGLKDSTSAQITVLPDTTKVYTVLLTKGSCVFSDTVHVAVLSSPNVAISGPDTVCNGSTVRYSVLNLPNVSNTWQVSGGSASNTSPDTLSVTWNATGVQTITLISSNGTCRSTSTKHILVGNQVSPQITGQTTL